VLSTMQDFPLTITHLFDHGRWVHSQSEVVTSRADGTRRSSFAEIADRADRLAAALERLGVGSGDRVGTFLWNTHEHLEAYLAVPSMGAVLHTLNLRLFPAQLAQIINHAEDKVILVEDSLVPLLAAAAGELRTVERLVVIGSGDASALGAVDRYEDLLGAEEPGYAWPVLDERSAAAMCYTSGTTGAPKGVVYSHRSTFLHAFGSSLPVGLPVSDRDRVLVIVPMFHANAWGIPYSAWMLGADLIFPERYVQAEPLCALIAAERPTVSAGVPTVWSDVLNYGAANPDADLSSLRLVTAGGSAPPRALMEDFQLRFGVRMIQGWGMTETSPCCTLSHPPRPFDEDDLDWRTKAGRVLPGVELRIVAADGTVLPNDGKSQGEVEVRGPWITGSYYRDPAPEKFDDGWLRTGDIGTLDEVGFLEIRDRVKDVIKSGGEWISSVELENELMAHPDVVEAAVVAVPDPKWEERPLAVVVRRAGSEVSSAQLRAFLEPRVARWWVPERWAFVAELPKTGVGKFDKKELRARYHAGDLTPEAAPAVGS
jgi:fatty-acyl-CoA synthase